MTTKSPYGTQEHRLIEGLCRGEEWALVEVHSRHASRVFELVCRIVIDRRAAEDVTQEVFLHLWTNANRIDVTRGDIHAFIVTVARSRAIDYVRRSERRRHREARSMRLCPQSDSIQPDFSDELIAHQSRMQGAISVRNALRDLPEAQRMALDLAYFREHSLREVAAVTNAPVGTAKTRVRLGLRRLRQNTSMKTARMQ